MTDLDAPQHTSMICFSVYATSHAFTRLYQTLLAEYDLTYPQFLVLLSLRDKEGQSVSDLSQTISIESNTLSPMLKRIEAKGLISRQRSLEDERRMVVALTPKGMDLTRTASIAPAEIMKAIDLSEAELAQCLATLQKVRAALRDR